MIGPLPAPPGDWWAGVPAWGYFLFFLLGLLVIVVAAPAVQAWARGQPGARQTREQVIAAREARLDAQEQGRLARLEADLVKAEADAVHGWSLERGWMLKCHELLHDWRGAVLRANELLRLFNRLIDGKISMDIVKDRIADLQPLPTPPDLPGETEIEPKAPGETPYA